MITWSTPMVVVYRPPISPLVLVIADGGVAARLRLLRSRRRAASSWRSPRVTSFGRRAPAGTWKSTGLASRRGGNR